MAKEKKEKPSFTNDLLELMNLHNVICNLYMIPDHMPGKHILGWLINREYQSKRKSFEKYNPDKRKT